MSRLSYARFFIQLLCLCLMSLCSIAYANSPQARQKQESNTIVEIRTVSIQSYREQQVQYCLDALNLHHAQSLGRLVRTPKGISVNACSQILQRPNCRVAFVKAGHKGALNKMRFRKISAICAVEYCNAFRRGDYERVCANGIKENQSTWLEDFYTTAIRHELLEFHQIHHLVNAPQMANGILIPR